MMEVNPYDYQSYIYQELRKSIPDSLLEDYAQDVLLDLLQNQKHYKANKGGDANDPYFTFIKMRIQAVLSQKAYTSSTIKRTASVASLDGLLDEKGSGTMDSDELLVESLYEPSRYDYEGKIQELKDKNLLTPEISLLLRGLSYQEIADIEGVSRQMIQKRVKSVQDRIQGQI